MTPQHLPRRQDQPITLGPSHGYRIEGDHAFINAELHLPPFGSNSEGSLELWACEQPYHEGPLSGAKVAAIPLELPTPLAPYVHNVDVRTTARPPLQGRSYAMVLAVVQQGPDGQPSVRSFANYPALQSFTAPHFAGHVSYRMQGTELVFEAESIFNPRSETNVSGTLALELWADPVDSPAREGVRMATTELAPLAGQASLPDVTRSLTFSEPPVGRYHLAMVLSEWTLADGFVARDRRELEGVYLRLAPEAPSASPAPPTVAKVAAPPAASTIPAPVSTPARPAEKLRLVSTPKAEVSDAKAKTSEKRDEKRKPGLVSIQTASLEQLAAVKGLTLKLAHDIVKARPFASLDDLINVRGIGEKTLERLKSLLTL